MAETTLSNLTAALDELATTLPAAINATLRDAGAEMVDAARAKIGTEAPDWPALAPATIETKARRGQVGRVSPTDPLLASGELRDSFTAAVGNGVLIFGSTDPVARYHEHGTEHMPPRPVVAPIAAEAGPRITAAIREASKAAIIEALRRHR